MSSAAVREFPNPSGIARAWFAAAILAAGVFFLPVRASCAEVNRLEPKALYLRTNMDVRSQVMFYKPPGPQAGDAARKAAVLLFSGEAGWRPLQQDTASYMAAEGHPVLGIDAIAYFKKRLDRGQWAADLEALRLFLNEQAGRPKDSPVALAGFYFGAKIIPFILNRTGAKGVIGTLLIAPDRQGFEVYRVGIRLKIPGPPEEQFDVAEEIRHMPPVPTAMLQGAEDSEGESRDLFVLLKGPRKLVPILGGDRQFHEVRDIYFTRVGQALGWMEDLERTESSSEPASGSAKPETIK
jgi:hypothetical protein